ncbi:reverse transcriptase [Elysia marginata]|uniref:Reverse transcriptase n=1 Tax=Elysia marginata TaxID=1093978 RepID=A0AAV4GMT8_9GAST|nr:reverse transcriptase [Elysia marginata]
MINAEIKRGSLGAHVGVRVNAPVVLDGVRDSLAPRVRVTMTAIKVTSHLAQVRPASGVSGARLPCLTEVEQICSSICDGNSLVEETHSNAPVAKNNRPAAVEQPQPEARPPTSATGPSVCPLCDCDIATRVSRVTVATSIHNHLAQGHGITIGKRKWHRQVCQAIKTGLETSGHRCGGKPNRPGHASKLHKVWGRYPRKALRKVLGDESPHCSGGRDRLEQYVATTFHNINISRDDVAEAKGLFGNCQWEQPDKDETRLFQHPPSADEILRRLKKTVNTFPVMNGIEWRYLKAIDRIGILRRTALFVVRDLRIPSSWRKSRTVTIHKKSGTDDPSNFRPIFL